MAWGLTGPMLRAAGLPWDWRKQRPYSHYDWFDFDVPVGTTGDCYDRAAVHVEEMRQSLRIIRQVVDAMPDGPYKAYHPLATPPMKEPHTMHDIESLITHFLGVTLGAGGAARRGQRLHRGHQGPVQLLRDQRRRQRGLPDQDPHARRSRTCRCCRCSSTGYEIADLVTVLGSIDFVMADVDR